MHCPEYHEIHTRTYPGSLPPGQSEYRGADQHRIIVTTCSEFPEQEFDDYVTLYLNEEIQAEGVTRKLPQFTRFLEVAALSNTRQLNFTNIARDVGVSRQTVTDWYQILVDTIIGYELPSFTKGKKIKTFGMPKLNIFDVGVARVLQNSPVPHTNQVEFESFPNETRVADQTLLVHFPTK